MQVNMIALPDMVPLDRVGPYDVPARVPGWTVDLVAAGLSPVVTDKGLAILPDRTPFTSPPEIVERVLAASGPRRAKREAQVAEAAERLRRTAGP